MNLTQKYKTKNFFNHLYLTVSQLQETSFRQKKYSLPPNSRLKRILRELKKCIGLSNPDSINYDPDQKFSRNVQMLKSGVC